MICNACKSRNLTWIPSTKEPFNGYWLCDICKSKTPHLWRYWDGKVIENSSLELFVS